MAWVANKIAEAAFRALLPTYIKAGFSANRAIRTFAAEGIGFIPRQIALGHYRSAAHKKIKEDFWRSKSIYDLPQESAITASKLKGTSKYRASFRLSIFDQSTGEREDKFITVYTNSLDTPANMIDKAVGDLKNKGSEWTVDYGESEVLELTRNKNYIA